ncbi:unnamed protein product [Alopecurus aequalis]
MASAANGGDDGVDHITDLSDDLLLHVFRFLPDARDVVCTSVLSTRWRSLWMRAPVLRLGNWILNGRHGEMYDPRFNDFAHNVLARRAYCGGAEADIDTLVLMTVLWPGKSRADDVVGVLRVGAAAQKALYDAKTRVQFLRLTELTLTQIWFTAEDGPRLSHLLSSPSCCPMLRKLTLSHLSGLHDLRLHGGALETLHLDSLSDVRRLDVDAPRLSTLSVETYFMFYHYEDDETINVRAPALEELQASLTLGSIQLELQRRTIHLLQQCRPLRGHRLYLQVPEVST